VTKTNAATREDASLTERQCKKRKREELGHMKEKKEEMEGMGRWAKSSCACGCSPDGHAASTRGMKGEKSV
jgi:hypothetical protein